MTQGAAGDTDPALDHDAVTDGSQVNADPGDGAADGGQDVAPADGQAAAPAAPIATPEDEAYAADLARFAAPPAESAPTASTASTSLTADDVRAAAEDALIRREEIARADAARRAAEAERAALDAAEAEDDRPLTRGEYRKLVAEAANAASQTALKPILDRIEATERAAQQALLAEARAERASRIDTAATLKHHPELRSDFAEAVDEAIEAEIVRRARAGNKSILTRAEMQGIVERVDRRHMRTAERVYTRARPRAAAPAGTGAPAPRAAASEAPPATKQPDPPASRDRESRMKRFRGAFGLN